MAVVEQIISRSERSEYPRTVESARAVAGKGLEGDFYFGDDLESGQSLTLIAAEAIEAFNSESGLELTHADTRRQVLTRGIDLNALVGRRFRVGDVECLGIQLCEPCTSLEAASTPGVIKGLVHRGGLNADILSDGEIAVGDEVVGAD
jgi:MOSC domain-containing protein YiiM